MFVGIGLGLGKRMKEGIKHIFRRAARRMGTSGTEIADGESMKQVFQSCERQELPLRFQLDS